jgi:hypothetical protein
VVGALVLEGESVGGRVFIRRSIHTWSEDREEETSMEVEVAGSENDVLKKGHRRRGDLHWQGSRDVVEIDR